VQITIDKIGEGREPISYRNPSLLYGLGNLIENAIDFAATKVTIQAEWNSSIVKVTIADDGPGFAPDVIAHIGEPYLTTRDERRAKSEEGSGLGLGLFIAKTLLERSGAVVNTANRTSPASGAIITMIWPRAVFERRDKHLAGQEYFITVPEKT
jgi:two-component system sensor histidine kinase RegB